MTGEIVRLQNLISDYRAEIVILRLIGEEEKADRMENNLKKALDAALDRVRQWKEQTA